MSCRIIRNAKRYAQSFRSVEKDRYPSRNSERGITCIQNRQTKGMVSKHGVDEANHNYSVRFCCWSVSNDLHTFEFRVPVHLHKNLSPAAFNRLAHDRNGSTQYDGLR